MIHTLLIALLAVGPVVDGGMPDLGASDAPVLIDLNGSKVDVVEPLPLGTVCLTHTKAASVRDDLADKNARVASLEASLATNWPVVLLVAAGGVLLAGGAAAAGYYAGQQHQQPPTK